MEIGERFTDTNVMLNGAGYLGLGSAARPSSKMLMASTRGSAQLATQLPSRAVPGCWAWTP